MNLRIGWVTVRIQTLGFEFVIDTVVNDKHPSLEIQRGRNPFAWNFIGMLAIVIRERGATELTRENIGERFKEGSIT
jgi:hypothetical protein